MRKLKTLLLLPILMVALASTACGPVYGQLAKGLYGISIGFDKLEKWNEASFRSGDIDKAAADKINNDIIKGVQIKRRANTLMGTINPDAPTSADVDSVLAIAEEAATVIADAQAAGELGIKSKEGKQAFGLIMTGFSGSIAIVRAVKK